MAAIAPVGHGPLNVDVNFNESPPVYYSNLFERDTVFSLSSGSFSDVKVSGQQYQLLPEKEGLFGLALRPKREHYHNFLYSFGSIDSLVEDNYRICHGLLQQEKTNLLRHFGWKVLPGWYAEYGMDKNSEGNDEKKLITPLIHGKDYTENMSGSTTELTDYKNRQLRGAKWGYKLLNIPIHSFALSTRVGENGLTKSDDKVAKLVPWQTQLQGNKNGPTEIGVHWGLEKLINIPYGLGFYIDFYVNKDIDPPTNDEKLLNEEKTDYVNPPFFFPDFETAFKASGSESGWENTDIFTGDTADDKNSAFYFINKSYIVVQITGNSSIGNCFFLVITSEGHPKLFQVYKGNSTKKVVLLSEYNPNSGDSPAVDSGLKMLKGDQGFLRIQVRQIGRHIIIENNVFEEPWVIALPSYKNNPVKENENISSDTSSKIKNSGNIQINQIGGSLRVFGGNISCGVSFCHLNYYDRISVSLKDQKIFGKNRSFYSKLSYSGANGMHPDLKTSNKFYPNIAQEIIDDDGLADLSLRPGSRFYGFGASLDFKSKIQIEDVSSSSDKYSVLSTNISLLAGRASIISGEDIFDYGYCITPVLQYCRQYSPPLRLSVKTNSIKIEDIVESIEITREAEDYHAVSASGSMSINIMHPSVNSAARSAIIDSIGKARYVSIDAGHFGATQNVFGAYRGSQAPGGNIYTGNGGDKRIFTGIAFNPTITEEAGKRFIKMELKDFWTIFESKLIINSPYFDGALDTDVIDYMLEYTGFKDKSGVHFGSRDAMPISFSFNSPNAKFDDRKPVSDAIKEIARKYSKYAFFNAQGRFCYKPIPANLITGSSGPFASKFNFYSSHIGVNKNIFPIGAYQSGQSGVPSHNSQVAYSLKTTQWNNKDVFNKLLILSVDARNRGIIVVSDTNYDSLINPDSLGFLGYERSFLQDEAAFGDYDRARKVLRYYSRMFRPVYTISWKCMGGNLGIDIFDMVSVDGALVIITRISHTIDAKNNLWETEYSGEWIYPPLVTGNSDISN